MFSNPEKNLIQLGLSQGMVVADFGCGSGFYTFLSAQKVGNEGKVFALDIHKDILSRVSKEAEGQGLHNIEIVWADLEKPHGSTLPKQSVDVVLIANTLFGVQNKKSFFEEVKRVLKEKGRVMLIEWADSFAGMGPHRDHVITKDSVESIITDSGFTIEREIEAGEHHYGLVLRKA